jgi:hypothetical protein
MFIYVKLIYFIATCVTGFITVYLFFVFRFYLNPFLALPFFFHVPLSLYVN